LAGIKHLNRLEQILARAEWDNNDTIDGIMLNNDHHIVECTMSNVFWVSRNQLCTPDLSQCGVEGVMRANVLRLAKELQLSINIGYFSIEDLLVADEVFITNSVFEICPVRTIGSQEIRRGWGPVTNKIVKLLNKMLKEK
jgi:4-amino-4-deoxychorismate lyase